MARPSCLRVAFSCCWATLALLAGCDARAPAAPVHSVLLVTLDTARADVLDGNLESTRLAPRIAALEQDGVRFPHAYSVAPLTLPAHASLFTGLVPPRHAVHDNGRNALPQSATTLAELLRAQGFDTAAFVSSLVLDRGFGLDQGFALYDQPPLVESKDPAHHERPAAATVRAAAAWLAARAQSDDERPFFLWTHLYDAHLPYASAPDCLERARGDPYRGEIVALDDAVGVLIDALAEAGLDGETLVVVTADHGESLGEHGEVNHGALCYEATMRVPLLFHFPAEPPLPGPAHLASLVDLTPTLLGLLDLPCPGELDGLDLFAPETPADRGLYLESYSGYLNYGWSPLVGWLDARGKYLHSSRPEFYLSLQDPGEHHDLVASRQLECERARARLAQQLARPALPHGTRPEGEALDDALAALGYARGSGPLELPSPLAPSDRPSPAERRHELLPLHRANALFEAQRYPQARAILADLVRDNPRHLLALDLYSLCLMYAREFEQAEGVLRQRLGAGPEVADAHLNLGLCRLELGYPEEALKEIEAARRLAPENPEVLAARERVLRRLGR